MQLQNDVRKFLCTYVHILGAQTVLPRTFLQSGPIFLDDLSCTTSDDTLEGCSRGIDGIGLTTCSHTKDVWVQCSGTYIM